LAERTDFPAVVELARRILPRTQTMRLWHYVWWFISESR